jgi:hypothetical protein
MTKPGTLGKEASAQLDTLTQTFPFFQTAHLLYIKSLHNENSFLYNTQLKVAATYATNRKVLYELITKKGQGPDSYREEDKGHVKDEVENKVVEEVKNDFEKKEIVEEKSHIAEKVSEDKEIIQPEFPKKRFGNDPDEWESGMMRQLQLLHHWKTTPQEILAKRIEEINAEKANALKSEEPKPPSAQDEINTLLYVLVEPGESEDISQEEEILQATDQSESWEVTPIETDVENENVEAKNENRQIPQDEISQEIIREAISSSIEMEVEDTLPSLEELGIPNRVVTEDKGQVAGEKNQVISDKKPGIGKVEEKEAEPKEELTFTSWLKQINQKSTTEKPTEISTEPISAKPDLVEKFIKEEPRIKPSKTSFFNPVNMAKKSVQDNDEFLTETLARIYAKQGNLSKAIRAYQKLSLKFPEKSSYFAALIEELKRTPK